ncbi:MAG: hypothetical protein K5886_04395 [Lachnospiraceae bacterium]|nr:hypothetical protein [Lachnospiraceae bacterium]
MKKLTSAVNGFSVICSTLYYRLNIKCKEELCESEFFDHYCKAAFNLSHALVKTPYFYGRIKSLGYLHSCDHDDIAQELSILLINKYTTIIRAMAKNGEEHNHMTYSYSILSSMLISIYRSYTFRENRINEPGNDRASHYVFLSLNTLISESDSETTFCDLLQGDAYSDPDTELEIDNESREAIFSYMKTVADHRYKGEVLAFLMFGLEAEDSRIKVREASKAIYNNGEVNISAFYHSLLKEYNELVLHLSDSELSQFFDYSEADFGEFDRTSPKSIASKLSKWNNLVKTDLALLSHRDR